MSRTDLCRSASTIQESFSLDWPRGDGTHGPGLQTIVTVVDRRMSSDQRPDSCPQYLLIVKLPLVHRHINQPPSDLQSPGKVDIVVPAPEAGQDGGDVEGAVPHDVELLESLPHPLVHGGLFARHQVAVHVAGAEHLHSWVSESLSEGDFLSVSITLEAFLHLESPESSNWEFLVQISN